MHVLPRLAAALLAISFGFLGAAPLVGQESLFSLGPDTPVRLEVMTDTGPRSLAGALVETGTRTIVLQSTVPEVTIVSATLTPVAPDGDDRSSIQRSSVPRSSVAAPTELVDRASGIAGDAAITTTLELGLGSYTIRLVTRDTSGTENRFDGGFLVVPTGGRTLFSSVERPILLRDELDDESQLGYEAETLLLSFDRGVDLETVSASLNALGLAPEDWFRELAMVRARVPAGADPFELSDARLARDRSAVRAMAPNLVFEDDATLGERLPSRLASAYQKMGNADCSSAGTALRGCFDRGEEKTRPLPAFRYHFLYDTFAGHRLVEHVLRNVQEPRAIGIAIVDGGFGDGSGQNPSNLAPGDFLDFSTPPYFALRNGQPSRSLDANGRQQCRATALAPLAPCRFGLRNVPDTEKSHGTKVAMTAAGRPAPYANGSDRALLGTGPRARLRILKRADAPTAMNSIVPIYAAAIDPDVHVINTSFGVNVKTPLTARNTRYRFGDLMFNLVDVVREQGKIWTTSAGNQRGRAKRCTDPTRNARPCGQNHRAHFPSDLAPGPGPRGAMLPTILSVGNSETLEKLTGPEGLASGSNYGPRVSVVAGGGNIITLDQKGMLEASTGTSFSAPTVAGLAADMLHLNRNTPGARELTPHQIIEIVEATADDLGATAGRPTFRNDRPANGFDIAFGHGRINVWKALLTVANGGIDRPSTATSEDFPSLPTVTLADDSWLGFSIQSPIHDATLWLDGEQIVDPQPVQPTGGAPSTLLTAYKGVASTRVIQRGLDVDGDGIPDEDPTSGIVPVGTAAGEFIATFSAQLGDLICGDDASSRPCTLSLRRPGETAEDLPFFSLRLELDLMRRGQVPGVVYDDFVFEITATDYGDAPPNYPTRLSSNGARSLNAHLEWLGAHPRSGKAATSLAPDGVSFEPNADREEGGPDATVDPDGVLNLAGASGRDGKDHGVLFFPRTYVPGGTGRVAFTVCVAQIDERYQDNPDQSLWINGWIDWNTDMSFEETGNEHVVDGLSVIPAPKWAIRAPKPQGSSLVSQRSNCATFATTFPVPDAIGAGPLWARFRVDYGENAGRNDPRPNRPNAPFGWRSAPSLRVPELAPEVQDTGGPGLATGATRFGEVEDYWIGTDYGDAQDRLPDDRDAGSPDYPTRHASKGAYSLAIGREWLGTTGDAVRVSREIDACDTPRSAADQDVVDGDDSPNLGTDCEEANQDGGDLGVTLPSRVSPGEQITLGITVGSQIDLRGFSNRGAGPIRSASKPTLQPDCRLRPIPARPLTPARFRDRGRYAAHDPRRRLYLSAWADWNADGDWTDEGETVLDARPVDPEAFGPDGRYTPGEPFEDIDRDGVFTPTVDRFTPAEHDVAGLPSRTFRCPVRVPDGVALERDFAWRVRLAYGDDSDAVVRHAVAQAEAGIQNGRNFASPRGGSLWGEVEDHPQRATCIEVDTCDDSRLELRLRMPDRTIETLVLGGQTVWKVGVCDLRDDDGDGLEEVAAHLATWEMAGWSERWGELTARLRRLDGNGIGVIEERSNRATGTLDLPPFGLSGTAMGRFDVAFDLQLGDRRLQTPMITIWEEIRFKAPLQPDEVFAMRTPSQPVESNGNDAVDEAPIMLLDGDGQPTTIELLGVAYAPTRGNAPDS